jgi:hypothetical protein
MKHKFKKKYPDGGPIKTDRYGVPIDAKVEVNPKYTTSEYDPRTNTIYLGQDYDESDDYWKSIILAHENYHAFQFKDGYSTELPYDVPYKKPAMTATDDEFYGYHNRKVNEVFRAVDKFKNNSEFQFVPDDVIIDKKIHSEIYNDPTTLEGEARTYESTGQFTSEENFLKTLEEQQYKYGGNMKKKFKKKYAGGGLWGTSLHNSESSTMNDIALFAQAEALKNQGIDAVQGMANNYLANKGVSDEALNIINEDMGAGLSKIPGVGIPLSVAKGTYNMVTGKTKNRLQNLRNSERVDAFNNTMEANKLSGYSQDAAVTFAMGGDFSEFQGPTHEEGGVTINPQAEVEGGETKKGDYIFSDRLKVPGKKLTFAQVSKQIKKRYTDKRPNDVISKNAEDRELATLQDMQETVRGDIMSNAYTKAYGGFMKKKYKFGGEGDFDTNLLYKQIGIPQEEYTGLGEPVLPLNPNQKNPMYYVTPNNNVDFLPKKEIPDLMPPTIYNEVVNKTPTKLVGSTPVPPTSNLEKSTDMFGMQPIDYASAGIQSLSGLSQLYYGLRGPDEVPDAELNLVRPNKVNLTPAKRLAAQEADEAFNALDYDIRNNAGSAGNYLSNRISSGVKRARTKAKQLADMSMNEANTNAQIMNTINTTNSNILNTEEQLNLGQADKRIQERDAARMAVTEGLNNVGQSFGTAVNDKRKYDWQKLSRKYIGQNNYIIDEDGNEYFISPTTGKKIKLTK